MFNLGSLIYTLALDDAKFKTELEKSSKELNNFAKDCEKIGKTLTLSLTAPLILAGGAAIKLAGDLEVAGKKFDKAFAGVGAKAQKELGKLTDEFGFSNLEAQKLLGNTADLLKGFGATSGQALDTSTKVQQLAAALSAYNGIPVEEASQKITKALLGETEGLKDLGIAISADAVQAELLATGQDNLSGTALNLAKSNIVLRLATEQSSDAVGAFSDNQNTLNFQMSKVQGQLMDLGAGFGEVLMPAVKSALSGVSDLIKYFTDMGPATKGLIVGLGGIAAVAGPVVLAFKAMTAENIKFIRSLLTNPFTAIITGALALGVAVASLVDDYNKNKLQNEELIKTYSTLNSSVEDFVTASGEWKKNLPEGTQLTGLAKSFYELGGGTDASAKAYERFTKYLKEANEELLKSQLTVTQEQIKQKEVSLTISETIIKQKEAMADSLKLSIRSNAQSGKSNTLNLTYLRQTELAITQAKATLNNDIKKLEIDTEYQILKNKEISLIKELSGEAQKERDVAKEIAEEKAKQAKEEKVNQEDKNKLTKKTDEINKDYSNTIKGLDEQYSAGILSEEELLNKRSDAAKKALESMNSLGLSSKEYLDLVKSSMDDLDVYDKNREESLQFQEDINSALVKSSRSTNKTLTAEQQASFDEAKRLEEEYLQLQITNNNIGLSNEVIYANKINQLVKDGYLEAEKAEKMITAFNLEESKKRTKIAEETISSIKKMADDFKENSGDSFVDFLGIMSPEELRASMEVELSDDDFKNYYNRYYEYSKKTIADAKNLSEDLDSYNVSLLGSSEDRIQSQIEKENDLFTWITYYEASGLYSLNQAEKLKTKLAEKGVNDRIKIHESEYTEFNQIANKFLGNISSTANALSTIGTNVIQAELNTSLTALDEKYNKQINNLESLSKATYETQIADANAKILIDKAMADETAKIQEEANQSVLDAEAEHLAEETNLKEEYSGKQLATKLADLDKAYLEEINSSKLATDRQIRDLDKVSIAKQAVSDEETRIKEKKAKDEEKINKDAAQRQYDIQLEGWKWSQALSIAQATANIPLLVLNALTGTAIYGPVVSTLAGVAAGIAGAAQLANIIATPEPVKPRLYDGGIITPTVGGRNVTIGEAGSPEAVMPLNDAFFNRLADAATGANYGSLSNNSSRGNTTIPIYLDGKMITEVVVDNINNRQSFIQSSSIV